MLMNEKLDFTYQLVKGRIAETIFAEMYRLTGKYTVLEFGYEKIIPELVGAGYDSKRGVVETLRTAPDFAVIDMENKHVKLVEVKYRREIDTADILHIAKRMSESWNPSYLFISTLTGFYFDEISMIIRREGQIARLSDDAIPLDVQAEHLKILQDFERGKITRSA